jgi:hypothetical protein
VFTCATNCLLQRANFPEKVLSAVKWLGRVNLHCACNAAVTTLQSSSDRSATVPLMLATSYLFGQSPRSMIFLAAV